MESLCYSANKGSDDAYDVSTSLTFRLLAFASSSQTTVPVRHKVNPQELAKVTAARMQEARCGKSHALTASECRWSRQDRGHDVAKTKLEK